MFLKLNDVDFTNKKIKLEFFSDDGDYEGGFYGTIENLFYTISYGKDDGVDSPDGYIEEEEEEEGDILDDEFYDYMKGER